MKKWQVVFLETKINLIRLKMYLYLSNLIFQRYPILLNHDETRFGEKSASVSGSHQRFFESRRIGGEFASENAPKTPSARARLAGGSHARQMWPVRHDNFAQQKIRNVAFGSSLSVLAPVHSPVCRWRNNLVQFESNILSPSIIFLTTDFSKNDFPGKWIFSQEQKHSNTSCASALEPQPLRSWHFAHVAPESVHIDNTMVLQCVWCGEMVEQQLLAHHFQQEHGDNVIVPRCNLCVRELVINGLVKVCNHLLNYCKIMVPSYLLKISTMKHHIFCSGKVLGKHQHTVVR